jgi:4-hydroxyphenylacetate 3-monooxygenase
VHDVTLHKMFKPLVDVTGAPRMLSRGHQRPSHRVDRVCEAQSLGLLMPKQSALMTGSVLASSQLHNMMHITRELCGGQICVTPDAVAFRHPETAPWLEKYYNVNENWQADDRRRLLAFARDLLNSDYAGHRLTFQLFARSPPYANLAAVYRNFDWEETLRVVLKSAGRSDQVRPGKPNPPRTES